MKLKYLLPMTLSVAIVPSIALVSCNNEKPTPDQINEQLFLVNEAAQNKYVPKVELTKDINISEIDSTLINFNNIPEKDKKFQKLSFEILNFEIPLVNATDTDVNVKVSSTLDKEVYQIYSFKISSAIVNNGFTISPMSQESFEAAVKKVYFTNEDFLPNLINDISIRIGQAGNDLDITVKKIINNNPTLILDIPADKTAFIASVQSYIKPTIINTMNGVALQRGLGITILDIKQVANAEGSADLNVDINFGANSIYHLPLFRVSSFSTQYANLTKQLGVILSEKIKPILLVGETTGKIPIWDLYRYISVEIPENLNLDQAFIIGINTNLAIPAPPTVTEDFEVSIDVFAKNYPNRIVGSYKIKIREFVNYSIEKIDFTAIKPITPPNPFARNKGGL